MKEEFSLYLIGGLVLLVGAVIALTLYYEKKRTEKLKQRAIRMGYQFEARSELSVLESSGGFYLLSRGHSRKIRNRMFGDKDNVESMLFGYLYTTGSGRNSTTHRQTVACFRLKTELAPAFSLRPENVFHRVGALFGQQDIDFADRPDFSKKYLLQGRDEDRIRVLFNREITGYFEQHPGVSVESDGVYLLVYRHNKRVKPADMESFYTEAKRIYDLFD